jgi:hypothetical protein
VLKRIKGDKQNMKYCEKYPRKCFWEGRDLGVPYCCVNGQSLESQKECILKYFIWEVE